MSSLVEVLYSQLVEGIVLLSVNPVECAAIGMVQFFSIGLIISLACRLFGQAIVSRRLRASARPWLQGKVRSAFEQCVEVSRVRVAPTLAIAPESLPPAFTLGMLRPVVFISPQLAERLDRDALRTVLLHELAHVKRRDNLTALLIHSTSIIALALLLPAAALAILLSHDSIHFGSLNARLLMAGLLGLLVLLHRLVWRPMRILREFACDDAAVAAGADPIDLAAAIGTTWRLQQELQRKSPAAAAHGLLAFDARVERRIERLLAYRAPLAPPRLRRALQACAGIALALSVLALVDTRDLTRKVISETLGWSEPSRGYDPD